MWNIGLNKKHNVNYTALDCYKFESSRWLKKQKDIKNAYFLVNLCISRKKSICHIGSEKNTSKKLLSLFLTWFVPNFSPTCVHTFESNPYSCFLEHSNLYYKSYLNANSLQTCWLAASFRIFQKVVVRSTSPSTQQTWLTLLYSIIGLCPNLLKK